MFRKAPSRTIKREILAVDQIKHNNERIYYNIDAISSAVINKKKISFCYFDYQHNGQKTYNQNGKRYEVNPLGIVYPGDYLYLLGFHDECGTLINYRIDRMDEVNEEAQDISEHKLYKDFDINTGLFSVCSGERVEVSLTFPLSLIGVVIDKFGENIRPTRLSNDKCLLRIVVNVNNSFFSWLTTFEGQIAIRGPESVKEKYKRFIENLIKSIV